MTPQKIKDDLVGRLCFLNNKPAKIIGRMLDYAKVVTFDETSAAEFSWDAVKRIMDKDGKFYSN